MGLLLPLFFGFLTALIGVFPPGLINMTAAKISVQDGKQRALLFSLGAVIIVFFQTILAVIFARYIDKHQEVVVLLKEAGFVVFTLLTIYFFFTAKKPKEKTKNELKIKSKRSRFFLGLFISAINFFPIPYYAVVCIALASFQHFVFNKISIYSFAIGTVLGSFVIFYAYIAFFKKIEAKTDFMMKNINKILGTITAIISISTLFYIVKFYLKA
jgi:threonine/homoserine/homoserine lactone efflux protein